MKIKEEPITVEDLILSKGEQMEKLTSYASSFNVGGKTKRLAFNLNGEYVVIQNGGIVVETEDASEAVEKYNSI